MSQHVPTLHVLAILGPLSRIYIYISASKQFLCKYDAFCVVIGSDNSNRTLYSNSRTLEDGGVLTGMSARLSTFTGSSRKPRGSHTGNSQRREEVTFLKYICKLYKVLNMFRWNVFYFSILKKQFKRILFSRIPLIQ